MAATDPSTLAAELAARRRFRDDYPLYAGKCLKIRPKAGGLIPFRLNAVQRIIHDRLETQLVDTGRVRALILKARQPGCSTYVQGRFYHKVTHRKGVRAFILTHKQDATDNLFAMTERFHEHCPAPLKPHTGAANAKELRFDLLDSGYKVGTAGAEGVGRSDTIQYFHGCLGLATAIICGETGAIRCVDDVCPGDAVITHTGEAARVSFVSSQVKPAFEVVFKGLRDLPLVATAEHRFWTKQGWRRLDEMVAGDCIGFPVRRISGEFDALPFRAAPLPRQQGGGIVEQVPETVAPSYELGRVVGLYLANGSIKRCSHGRRQGSGVHITVHERDVDRTREWLAAVAPLFRSVQIARRPDSKAVNVTAYGRSFAEFMHGVAGACDEKRFPRDWHRMGEPFVRGLVHGYLAGDGHVSPQRDRRISLSSIRSATVIGLRDALAALGYGWAGISRRPAAVRHGRNEREQWVLRLTGAGVDRLSAELGKPCPPRRRQDCGHYGTVVVQDGYAWVPVESIMAAGEQEVRDFEVFHGDHSYCTVHGATHNSEVAHWKNADQHMDGVMQAVPDVDGTEVILESTANGLGGLFYAMCKAAERGDSAYILIFVPWFAHGEYRKQPPEGWQPPEAIRDYGTLHGLDDEQLYWCFTKNRDLAQAISADAETICWKFQQEFPATAEEAFQTGGDESFIPSEAVLRARKATVEPPKSAPIVLGVDVARGGGDKSRIIDRQGRKLGGHADKTIDSDDLMTVAGLVAKEIQRIKPAKVFVDVTGLGAGVVDRLVEMGYGDVVQGVNFGSAPIDGERYANKRAEMWDELRAWLDDPAGADIPDDDALHTHLCAPVRGKGATRYDSNSRLVLEPKEHIKERVGFSPDGGDAAALTFAFPVASAAQQSKWDRKIDEFNKRMAAAIV